MIGDDVDRSVLWESHFQLIQRVLESIASRVSDNHDRQISVIN